MQPQTTQAQTQQKASAIVDNNQPKISDHIFTTLRKDNALYDLQQNITIPAGKDMTYVDITADGKVVAATSRGIIKHTFSMVQMIN